MSNSSMNHCRNIRLLFSKRKKKGKNLKVKSYNDIILIIFICFYQWHYDVTLQVQEFPNIEKFAHISRPPSVPGISAIIS